MKVILLQDVPNLGEEGDIRTVKGGFARNFLIPRHFATPFSKHAESILHGKKRILEQRKEERKRRALDLSERLSKLKIEVAARASETGKLFGSVTSAAISDLLNSEGISLDKRHIELPHKHLREVGSYAVKMKLYEGQVAQCTLNVIPGAEDNVLHARIVGEDEKVSAVSDQPSEESVSEEAMSEEAAPEASAETSAEVIDTSNGSDDAKEENVEVKASADTKIEEEDSTSEEGEA